MPARSQITHSPQATQAELCLRVEAMSFMACQVVPDAAHDSRPRQHAQWQMATVVLNVRTRSMIEPLGFQRRACRVCPRTQTKAERTTPGLWSRKIQCAAPLSPEHRRG
jgi:hypothetical protein